MSYSTLLLIGSLLTLSAGYRWMRDFCRRCGLDPDDHNDFEAAFAWLRLDQIIRLRMVFATGLILFLGAVMTWGR